MANFITTPFSPSPKDIKYDSDGYPVAFSSSSSGESERSSCQAGPSTMMNNDGDAVADSSTTTPTTPLFAKTRVPTRQERANKGLLTSSLTAAVSHLRVRNPSTPLPHLPPLPPYLVDQGEGATMKTTAKKAVDTPWICDNCGTTNQPFDFLCWFCRVHARCPKCASAEPSDALDMPSVDSRFSKSTLLNMPLTDSGDLTKRVVHAVAATSDSSSASGTIPTGPLSLLGKTPTKNNRRMPSRKGTATVKVSGVNALSTYY